MILDDAASDVALVSRSDAVLATADETAWALGSELDLRDIRAPSADPEADRSDWARTLEVIHPEYRCHQSAVAVADGSDCVHLRPRE